MGVENTRWHLLIIDDGAVIRHDQAARGHAAANLLGPVFGKAVEAGLQRLLTLRMHPAQTDGEDPDSFALHAIRH